MQAPAGSPFAPDQGFAPAEQCVLILAPLGNDARLAAGFLRLAGIQSQPCASAAELCEIAHGGCGAWLLAEEALNASAVAQFNAFLASQPSWSEITIILITSGGDEVSLERRRRLASFGPGGNVTLLERPFRPGTLVSALEVALRGRARQFQVRDLLAESRSSREHLEFVLEAGDLGTWTLDLRSRALSCSPICRANFGIPAEIPLSYEALTATIHPDDRPQWERAVNETVATGRDLVAEYRIAGPAGESRWIQVKGRVARDASGALIHLSGVSQNITARKEAEAALRDADRRKDEFLAMLAHELRNPLASVNNAVALLKEEGTDETRAWAADVIARQNGQLARLVDDLLDVSRITRGKIELRKELLDAARCLESACEAVGPLIASRGHTLLAQIPCGELWLEADATRLEQIAVNLLANAAKYTEPHGRIWVDAKRAGDEIVIQVRDSGIGIAPEHTAAMFELFAQGERTAARTEGGLGIGLTVVRGLCELHGGSVTAHSEGRGRGSNFTVRLPAAAAPGQALSRNGSAGQHHEGYGRRVLIVEDNVDTATGLGRLLARRGYDVRLAHTGADALEIAAAFAPAIVLLDIGLPGMDGYEVARTIRKEAWGLGALVVALSGYGQDEDRARSRDAGFDHHLVKPVDLEALRTLLAQVAAG